MANVSWIWNSIATCKWQGIVTSMNYQLIGMDVHWNLYNSKYVFRPTELDVSRTICKVNNKKVPFVFCSFHGYSSIFVHNWTQNACGTKEGSRDVPSLEQLLQTSCVHGEFLRVIYENVHFFKIQIEISSKMYRCVVVRFICEIKHWQNCWRPSALWLLRAVWPPIKGHSNK